VSVPKRAEVKDPVKDRLLVLAPVLEQVKVKDQVLDPVKDRLLVPEPVLERVKV
jgi:hypothetical protein